MPSKPTSSQSPAPKGGASGIRSFLSEGQNTVVVVVAAVFIVAIFVGAFFYEYLQSHQTTFATFKSNFVSAQNVNILVTADNGTALSGTMGCATNIIQQIVASRTNHREPSTITFYVVNQTGCTYEPNGLGSVASNFSKTTVTACLNMAHMAPAIFINYSRTNRTVITPTTLAISGDAEFLRLCGVAAQLS